MKKIMPPQLFYISLFVLVLINYFYPLAYFIYFPFNLAGVVIFAAGLLIAVKGKETFKKAGTNVPAFNEPDILITDGLYKYSRNPMYLGFVLGLLGVAVLLGSVSAMVIVALFAVITDRWYIHFEEKILMNKFYEQYAVYKIRTRRWL